MKDSFKLYIVTIFIMVILAVIGIIENFIQKLWRNQNVSDNSIAVYRFNGDIFNTERNTITLSSYVYQMSQE